MSLTMESKDAFENKKNFYYEELSESANMTVCRKIIEELETGLQEKLENYYSGDLMPLDNEKVEEIELEMSSLIKNEFRSRIPSSIKFESGLDNYISLNQILKEILAAKNRQNLAESEQYSESLVQEMLEQMTAIEDLSPEDLRSQALIKNLEEYFLSLFERFFSEIRGVSPFKYFAEEVPKFILTYTKKLFHRVGETKDHYIVELQEKLSQTEFRLLSLKENLADQEK